MVNGEKRKKAWRKTMNHGSNLWDKGLPIIKHFFTLKEVAEYLSVHPKSVYRLIQSRQLPAAKIGKVYRIKVSDVDEFFELQKLNTKKEHPVLCNLEMMCPNCKKEWTEVFPKEKVDIYKKEEEEWPLTILCEQCDPIEI